MASDDREISRSAVSFRINGAQHSIDNPDPDLLLVDYLRSPEVGLTGTKLVCGQAGCGACTVLISRTDQPTGQPVHRAVNSCVHRVCQMEGIEVTTVEGVGSTRPPSSPDPIQNVMAERNGSQCGFCTPGWVMSMRGLLAENSKPTPVDIEGHFDGNLCRCTGYRPILDAMHSFDNGVGVPPSLPAPPPVPQPGGRFSTHGRGRTWQQVTSVAELGAMSLPSGGVRRLVMANTSQAIYPDDVAAATQLIDITGIADLYAAAWTDGSLHVGAGITLAEFMATIDAGSPLDDIEAADRHAGLHEFRLHLERVANSQVRNVATLGGNIMMTLQQVAGPEPFPSDVVLMAIGLEAVAAYTLIGDLSTHAVTLQSLEAGINTHDPQFVLTGLTLPPSLPGDRFTSAKITRRPQDSHAIVNGCFRVNLGIGNVITRTRFVLGGIGAWPMVLDDVGALLNGHVLDWSLITQNTVRSAVTDAVRAALKPTLGIPDQYRVNLAVNLVFEALVTFLIDANPNEVPAKQQLVGPIDRPVSTGSTSFPVIGGERPVGQAVPAIPAPAHATGEALFTHDLPWPPRTLHASYVYSEVRHAQFTWSAPLTALRTDLETRFPGVVDIVDASDIPVPTKNYGGLGGDDPIFAVDTITSYGMPIALVLANDPQIATDAAAYARATYLVYAALEPVVTTIDEALALPDGQGEFSNESHQHISYLPRPGSDTKWLDSPGEQPGETLVTGRQRTGGQNHFYLETQSALVVPGEPPAMMVHASTQSPASLQRTIAASLGLDDTAVTVDVIRLGGGYGGKETRAPFFAAAAAVAAHKWNRPVRLVLERRTDGTMMGGRHPYLGRHFVSAAPDGTIDKLKIDLVADGGDTYDVTFPVADLAVLSADGAYYTPTFEVTALAARTNLRTNTAMRSFGGVQVSLVLENAIEHLAHELGMRPEDIRAKNLYPDAAAGPVRSTPYGQPLNYCVMQTSFERLRQLSDFDARAEAVDRFNSTNRWHKRGISLIPLKYGISYTNVGGNQGGALININERDGSVSVSTGGIEMGQGLSTKMAQIAAYALGIDLARVSPAPTDTQVVPNASSTGASTGSDLNGGAVKAAATMLRDRIASFCAVNPKLVPDGWQDNWNDLWPQLVSLAYGARIDLSAQAWYKSPDLVAVPSNQPRRGGSWEYPQGKPFYYFSYSTACSEVEINVLTGEVQVVRTDILYDAGESLNPELDIGQIRGGFVQGLGNVTTEFIYYDDVGKPQTTGTWQYKVPDSLTIPVDFRVHLLSYQRTDPHTHLPLDPHGIQSSKSTGEPPLVLANTVFFAIKQAIASARSDIGMSDWFELEAPATLDRIQMACAGQAPSDPCNGPVG